MGTGAPAKFSPARGVILGISNSRFQINDFRAYLCRFVLLCAFFAPAGRALAQTAEAQTWQGLIDSLYFQRLSKAIEEGTIEEKRNALFEIRNNRSETLSRIAAPALKDKNEIVRATAAFSVIFLPKDEAFQYLAPNLNDRSELVRRETAYALGKTQNPAAINPLIQIFQKDKSVEVKNAAAIALGEIGDAAALDFLSGILRQKATDENEFLRRSAARSIGQIAQFTQIRKTRVVTPENFLPAGSKPVTLEKYENLAARFPAFSAAVPVLIQILRSPREADDAKREAAFALGAIGDPSALPHLQALTSVEDYYLAEIAKEAVKKLSSVTSSD
jgi:hypothetical protein